MEDVGLTRVPVVEEWRMVGPRMPWKEQQLQQVPEAVAVSFYGDVAETARLPAEVLVWWPTLDE